MTVLPSSITQMGLGFEGAAVSWHAARDPTRANSKDSLMDCPPTPYHGADTIAQLPRRIAPCKPAAPGRGHSRGSYCSIAASPIRTTPGVMTSV
jgi:hypothetical protein